MASKKADDWGRMSIRRGLLDKINEFLQTPEAKELGLTNASQVVDYAIREKMKELVNKRFEHMNLGDDKVGILDNSLGKNGDIVTVYFRDKSGWCDYCEKIDCIHVKYAWNVPDIIKILKRHGLKYPE